MCIPYRAIGCGSCEAIIYELHGLLGIFCVEKSISLVHDLRFEFNFPTSDTRVLVS